MGYSTNYLGRLDIRPPLNPDETTWLRAFSETDRALHPDDPYEVPMNPRGELAERSSRGDCGSRRGEAKGLLRCDWEPCVDGCCLVWNGMEKSNSAERELRYLIDHFLKPGAHAADDGRADFAAFTFDHTVSGVIAASRNDSGELFLLRARGNVIRKQVLVRGQNPCW